MKIYIAGSFNRRAEFLEYAEQLQDAGYKVTSSWLTSHNDDSRLNVDQLAKAAAEDLVDLRNADVVLSFTEPQESENKRGGRHVELGLALAWGKPCVVVGEKEHVFHHLPQMLFCISFGAALPVLNTLRSAQSTRELMLA